MKRLLRWLPRPADRCVGCWRKATHVSRDVRWCDLHVPPWFARQPVPVARQPVPVREQCSKVHPAICHRRATVVYGPYQWCSDHAPEWELPR